MADASAGTTTTMLVAMVPCNTKSMSTIVRNSKTKISYYTPDEVLSLKLNGIMTLSRFLFRRYGGASTEWLVVGVSGNIIRTRLGKLHRQWKV